MRHELDRAALREACRLFGGVRAVARRAQMDDGNLSKWLRGAATLSEAKIAELLSMLGLPDGLPRKDRVHEWRMDSVVRGDYPLAFQLFFSSGAEVAAAPWSQPGFQELIRRVGNLGRTPEIFGITDGRVRAVVRLSSNMLIQPKNIGRALTWRGGDRRSALLDIEKGSQAWCEGPLGIEDFDRGWGGAKRHELTEQDVLHVIRDEGLSYSQAIERLRRRE